MGADRAGGVSALLSWMPEAASSYAGELDNLISIISWIVGVWFVLVQAVLFTFLIRYRRRGGRRAAYLPGRSLRAMSWVLVPCAIILGFDLVIDAASAPVWDKIKIDLPPHDELVRIQGAQWMWQFTYPGPDGLLDTQDDFVSMELHVPVGKVVLFELTAKDVLHSFWVPQLRLKQDAVPGRTINGWFRTTKEGDWEVICAEICGILHTNMKAMIHSESPEKYQSWVNAQIAAAGSN